MTATQGGGRGPHIKVPHHRRQTTQEIREPQMEDPQHKRGHLDVEVKLKTKSCMTRSGYIYKHSTYSICQISQRGDET